ncbi:N-6 DNA methylase, partial [Phormidium sp. FACHB-1136]|uniref:N-6 DNA methylase n=1 Tax=Phormidium sp. FACHB-1136 TaxID=2692848 RepID=UPI001684D621
MLQTQTPPNSLSSEPTDWLALFAECDDQNSHLTSPPALALRTLAILNPPFGKQTLQREIAQTYELGHHWRKSKADAEANQTSDWRRTGQVKPATQLETLFLELALRSLAPGEVMVALVPNDMLADRESGAARHWLMNEAQIWASIQLPKEVWQAECKTGIITSIVVFQKPQEPMDDYDIFMAMVETCGFNSRGKPIPDSDLDAIAEEFRGFCQSSLPKNRTGYAALTHAG